MAREQLYCILSQVEKMFRLGGCFGDRLGCGFGDTCTFWRLSLPSTREVGCFVFSFVHRTRKLCAEQLPASKLYNYVLTTR